jgi:hypothetical protein
LGIVIALSIAWWQWRNARRAEAALKKALGKPFFESHHGSLTAAQTGEINDVTKSFDKARVTRTQYADVNDDGQEEMLIQYPVGAHGSVLKVFGWRGSEFGELASLSAGTPVGFDISDFDGDGKIEIRTEETDWTTGLPYVNAPRIVLLMRWDGTRFTEVSREKASGGWSKSLVPREGWGF